MIRAKNIFSLFRVDMGLKAGKNFYLCIKLFC